MTDAEFDAYAISDENPEVFLGYSSNTNISFYGTLATGYSKAEWDEFSDETKEEIFAENMYELVEIFELEPGETDYNPWRRF